jgi:putative ABC transport system permease protein
VLKGFISRLRFLPSRREYGELSEELQFHVEQSTAANIAGGMTAAEARRQALIEFGGVERTREQCYEQRPGWWMSAMRCAVSAAILSSRSL